MSIDFSSVSIGGRSLRYACGGDRAPTVIIEPGLGISVENGAAAPTLRGWANVFRELQQSTRVLMYDRAGVGNSDPASGPRTSADMLSDLRALLRNAQIPPPFVLVGHSMGGFTARMFAHECPKQVAGLVLVDSSHPDQFKRFADSLAQFGHAVPEVCAFTTAPSWSSTTEGFDWNASAAQVRQTTFLGDLHLSVLSHSPEQLINPKIPSHVAAAIERVWTQLQHDLCKLSTNAGPVIVASHAGHHIQLEEPEIVVNAIVSMVERVRGSNRLLN